jgi:hypothetical protein
MRYELYLCKSRRLILSFQGRVVVQATRRRRLTVEARVQWWTSPCVICSTQSGTVTGYLFSQYFSFPVNIIPPMPHTLLHLTSQKYLRKKPGNLPKGNAVSEIWKQLCFYATLLHSTARTWVSDTAPLHNLPFKAYSGRCLFVEMLWTEWWSQRIWNSMEDVFMVHGEKPTIAGIPSERQGLWRLETRRFVQVPQDVQRNPKFFTDFFPKRSEWRAYMASCLRLSNNV